MEHVSLTELIQAVLTFIQRFEQSRIVAFGDVMLDEYLWGQVRRISPEAPVPIVEEQNRSSVPGGAANVAVNTAALGAKVTFGGVVGDDAPGQALREMLTRRGIDTSGLRVDPQRPTTAKTRIIAHNQQIVRIDREDSRRLSASLERELLDWFRESLQAADLCILSDYAKGVFSPHLTSQAITLARELERPVIVDPKGRDFRRYRGANLISPNLSEAQNALEYALSMSPSASPDHVFALGAGLLEILPGSSVVITRGQAGVALFRDGRIPLCIPSVARQVFDVTGAGDTLIATLGVALSVACPLELALALANSAAGLVVGKIGTSYVTGSELAELVPHMRLEEVATYLGEPLPAMSRMEATHLQR